MQRIGMLIICIWLCLSLGLSADDKTTQLAVPLGENTTQSAPISSTTQRPKINILDSTLCKTCQCDKDNKLINCSGKLTRWFTSEEWKTLQDGDILFETIDMEHNNLTSIPKIPAYPVKHLHLAFNQISGIELAAFTNLTQLTKLDLSHNKLTSKVLVPDVFKGSYSPADYLPLDTLHSLNLGYNELHNLDADLFEHTPNIEELYLCKNIFRVIDHSTEIAISALTSLKTLDLSYMELKELPDTLLHGPRELETLILSGNLFDEISESFELAINLKSLVLDQNPIADLVDDNIFPNMINLRYLSISYMPDLSVIGKGSLSNLQNLSILIASDNYKLSYIDGNAFARNTTSLEFIDYPPLEKLYLNNNNLTHLSRSLIVRWDKVNTIDLRYNPWACDCTNNWLVNTLMKQITATTLAFAQDVKCATPNDFRSLPLITLHTENRLNCLQEGSSLVWVGLLIAILVAIPIAIGGFAIYRRGCFGLMHRNNRGAHRPLYDRASFRDELYI